MAYTIGNDPRAHIISDYLKTTCAAYWLGTVQEWRVEDARLFEKAKRAVEAVDLQSFSEPRVARLPRDERDALTEDIRALGGYAEAEYVDRTAASARSAYPVSYRFHFNGEEAASLGFAVVNRAMRAPAELVNRVTSAMDGGKFTDVMLVNQLQRSLEAGNLNRADVLAALDTIEPPTPKMTNYLRQLVEQGRANERSIGVSFRKNPELFDKITRAQAGAYIEAAELIVQPFTKSILIGYLEREYVRTDTIGRDIEQRPIDFAALTQDEADEIVDAVREWMDNNNVHEAQENLDIQMTDPETSVAAEEAVRFERLLTHYEATASRVRDGRIVPGSRNQDIRRSFDQGHHPRLESHEYNDSEIFEMRQRHEVSQDLRDYNDTLYGGDAQIVDGEKDMLVGRVFANNFRFVAMDITTDENRPMLVIHDKYDSHLRTDVELDVDKTLVIHYGDDGKARGMVTDIEDFGAAKTAFRLAYDKGYQLDLTKTAIAAFTDEWPDREVIEGITPGFSAGRAFYANAGFIALDLTEQSRTTPTVMLVDISDVRMDLRVADEQHDLGIIAFDCKVNNEGDKRAYGVKIDAYDLETARLELRATRAIERVLEPGTELRQAEFDGQTEGICIATEKTRVALFNGRDTYTMVAKSLLDNPSVVVGQYAKAAPLSAERNTNVRQQENAVRVASGRR